MFIFCMFYEHCVKWVLGLFRLDKRGISLGTLGLERLDNVIVTSDFES